METVRHPVANLQNTSFIMGDVTDSPRSSRNAWRRKATGMASGYADSKALALAPEVKSPVIGQMGTGNLGSAPPSLSEGVLTYFFFCTNYVSRMRIHIQEADPHLPSTQHAHGFGSPRSCRGVRPGRARRSHRVLLWLAGRSELKCSLKFEFQHSSNCRIPGVCASLLL